MRSLRRTLWSAVAAGLLATSGACQDAASPSPRPPADLALLFIGNSLTYVNDLPATLAAVATSDGRTFYVETIAHPNFGLIDHLKVNGEAKAAIGRGGWDYVVLQQGPSTLPINRDSLVIWTGLFDPLIRAAGARPALYMVWPLKGQAGGFDAVRVSYQMAAKAVDGLFLPAGAAWQVALRQDASLPLYGPDDFHPSPLGTYLAAITIYEALTGRDARNLSPYALTKDGALNIPTATVRALQAAAHEANLLYQ